MSDLERFKQYVDSVCPFPSDLLEEFRLVRDIKSVDEITDDDWKKLMVEFDAANIMWNEKFFDRNGEEVKVGDKVMWTNPEDEDCCDGFLDKYKLCTVENITEESIILKDELGDKIEASEDELEATYELKYEMYDKNDLHYGVENALRSIENARTYLSYIHNNDALQNKLDNMCEWFKQQFERTVANYALEKPF